MGWSTGPSTQKKDQSGKMPNDETCANGFAFNFEIMMAAVWHLTGMVVVGVEAALRPDCAWPDGNTLASPPRHAGSSKYNLSKSL